MTDESKQRNDIVKKSKSENKFTSEPSKIEKERTFEEFIDEVLRRMAEKWNNERNKIIKIFARSPAAHKVRVCERKGMNKIEEAI